MVKVIVFLNLFLCTVAVKLDSSMALTETTVAEMGTAQLMQMKNNLKHRVELNEYAKPEEKKVFAYFKELILNTSIPRLLFSAVKDNTTLLQQWQALRNCVDTLDAKRNNVWTQSRDTWQEYKDAHDQCRSMQARPNTTCEKCKNFTNNFGNRPTTPFQTDATPVFHTTESAFQQNLVENAHRLVEYGENRTYLQISAWFKEYDLWHCEVVACQDEAETTGTRLSCTETCVQNCLDEISGHDNRVQNCTEWQTKFEYETCAWDVHMQSACTHYTNCTETHDLLYSNVVVSTSGNHDRREVEFQIMKTIVCFLDLLTGNVPITNAMRLGCQKTYDMDFLELYFPHTEFQSTTNNVFLKIQADCACTKWPLLYTESCPVDNMHAGWNTGPLPCDNFEATYYDNSTWRSVVTPAQCAPCETHVATTLVPATTAPPTPPLTTLPTTVTTTTPPPNTTTT